MSEKEILSEARTLYAGGNYSQCIEKILTSNIGTETPCYASAMWLVGEAYFELENYSQVVHYYSLSMEARECESDITYNNRGLAFWYLEDYKSAEEDWIRSLELNELNLTSRVLLGELYIKVKRNTDAKKVFFKGIRLRLKHVRLYSGLGVIFYRLGEPGIAYKCWVRAQRIDPEDGWTVKGLARLEKLAAGEDVD